MSAAAAALCSRCGGQTKRPSQARYWCEKCEAEHGPNHHQTTPGRVTMTFTTLTTKD